MEMLGIDMYKAFDTIPRDCSLIVLKSFLEEDHVRLVKYFLARASLSMRIGGHISELFSATIGTSLGDSLSAVLFVIYLEEALRDLRIAAAPKQFEDAHLTLTSSVIR